MGDRHPSLTVGQSEYSLPPPLCGRQASPLGSCPPATGGPSALLSPLVQHSSPLATSQRHPEHEVYPAIWASRALATLTHSHPSPLGSAHPFHCIAHPPLVPAFPQPSLRLLPSLRSHGPRPKRSFLLPPLRHLPSDNILDARRFRVGLG